MEDKELTGFSWSGLFLVTGICSFIFLAAIKILDGTNSALFLFLGVIALFLLVVNWASRHIAKLVVKKKKEKSHLAS